MLTMIHLSVTKVEAHVPEFSLYLIHISLKTKPET